MWSTYILREACQSPFKRECGMMEFVSLTGRWRQEFIVCHKGGESHSF